MRTTFLLLVALAAFGSWTMRADSADQQPGGPKDRRAAARSRNLDLRYAEIVEEIAQINLRKAVDTNKQVAGSVSDTELQRLRENVRLAQQDTEKLRSTKQTGNDDRLREARARATLAEAELGKARQANRRVAGSVAAIEIERLQLEFEAAQVNVARQEAASDVPSALSEMREQIQELRGEIARLRRELSRIASANAPDETQTATQSKE